MEAQELADQFYLQLQKFASKKRMRTFFVSWKKSFKKRKARINSLVRSIDFREKRLKTKVLSALRCSDKAEPSRRNPAAGLGSGRPKALSERAKPEASQSSRGPSFAAGAMVLLELCVSSFIPAELRKKARSSVESTFGLLQEYLQVPLQSFETFRETLRAVKLGVKRKFFLAWAGPYLAKIRTCQNHFNFVLERKSFKALKSVTLRLRKLSFIRSNANKKLRSRFLSLWRAALKKRQNRKSLLKNRDPGEYYSKMLKRRYFEKLKKLNVLFREVKRLNTVCHETRKFYLQKSFFNPWKRFAQERKALRKKSAAIRRKNENSLMTQYLMVWVQASVLSYQATRAVKDKLQRKYFLVWKIWIKERMGAQIKKLKAAELFRQNTVERTFHALKALCSEKSRFRSKKVNWFAVITMRRTARIFRLFCKAVRDFGRKDLNHHKARTFFREKLFKKVFQSWGAFLEKKERLFIKANEAARWRRARLLDKALKALQKFYMRRMYNN